MKRDLLTAVLLLGMLALCGCERGETREIALVVAFYAIPALLAVVAVLLWGLRGQLDRIEARVNRSATVLQAEELRDATKALQSSTVASLRTLIDQGRSGWTWRMWRRLRGLPVALLLVGLCGCHTGNLGEDCNPDGTCNAPGLACQMVGIGVASGRIMECHPAPPTPPEPSCHGDADCFCEACLKRCGGAGLKLCAYTDPSVWGSKPTVCECDSRGPFIGPNHPSGTGFGGGPDVGAAPPAPTRPKPRRRRWRDKARRYRRQRDRARRAVESIHLQMAAEVEIHADVEGETFWGLGCLLGNALNERDEAIKERDALLAGGGPVEKAIADAVADSTSQMFRKGGPVWRAVRDALTDCEAADGTDSAFPAWAADRVCARLSDGTLGQARSVMAEADAVPAGQALAEGGPAGVEAAPAPASLTIALDYDGTFAADPVLWRCFAGQAKALGHQVVIVTGRSDETPWATEVRGAVGTLPVVFAGAQWKRQAAEAAGYKVAIWIDDHPEFIGEQDPELLAGKMAARPAAPMSAEVRALAEEVLRLDGGFSTMSPWVADLDDGEILNAARDAVVCKVQPHANVNTVRLTGQEFSHADARLIAAYRTAAPALARALLATSAAGPVPPLDYLSDEAAAQQLRDRGPAFKSEMAALDERREYAAAAADFRDEARGLREERDDLARQLAALQDAPCAGCERLTDERDAARADARENSNEADRALIAQDKAEQERDALRRDLAEARKDILAKQQIINHVALRLGNAPSLVQLIDAHAALVRDVAALNTDITVRPYYIISKASALVTRARALVGSDPDPRQGKQGGTNLPEPVAVPVADLLHLASLSLDFGRVERATRHQDGKRPETDSDHTVMLGLIACAYAARYAPHLDLGLIAQYSLVHDFVEVYSGDVLSLGLSADKRAIKEQREHEALERLRGELAGLPWVAQTIATYEALGSEEARFVKVLDKVLPKLTHLLNGGAALREHGFTFAKAHQDHQEQRTMAAKYPQTDALGVFDAVIGRCAEEWQGKQGGGTDLPEPLTEAERSEMEELRRKVEACGLGDRPHSPAVATLRRLMELEGKQGGGEVLPGPGLSEWIVVDGYCATRVLEGTDPSVVANRRAFIEKTPRVLEPGADPEDCYQWEQGPKGRGGGDPATDLTYGYDPKSRAWCDRRLREMGYVLPGPATAPELLDAAALARAEQALKDVP